MFRGAPRRWAALWVVLVVLATSANVRSDRSPMAPSDSSSGSLSVSGSSTARPAAVQVAPGFAAGEGTTEIGPLPGPTPLTVAVGLASQDSSGLEAYVAAEYSSGSPAASHFLSDSVLSRRYGAEPAAIDAARSYFVGDGLSVSVSPDHLLLFVSGPATDVARAFNTSFVEYRSGAGSEFFSHPTPAVLPSGIPWSGAAGLGNSSAIEPAVSAAVSSVPVAGPAAACSSGASGLSPCQVETAYDLEPLLAAGTNGSGYSVGIVDAYSSDEGESQLELDLGFFATQFGLNAGTVHFLYPVPTTTDLNGSGVNPDWAGEDALDLEWARAAAPGATIDYTFSPNAGIGLYEAVDWLVAHQTVNVISLSWGEPDVGVYNAFDTPCSSACNASSDGSYAILSPVLEFAAAEGISVFAAAGDCGAADGTSGVATNYPASDPYVTGVGGSVLNVTSNGTYESEYAWSGNATGASSPGCQNQGGSGGGYATFPRPWWQMGLASSPGSRGVPDVALDAGTAVAIILRGADVGVRGTSVGTPIWAGIATVLDQSAGGALGFLDPQLYRILNGPDYLLDFHDITAGSNGYSAGVGWDPVTGIGTPIVAALASDLSPETLPLASGPTTNLTAAPAIGGVPLSVTFRVGASGGTGTYPLEGVYFGDGTAGFATGGTATHTYTVPGVYAAQSFVVDSSGNGSASSPALVIAGGGSLLSVALAASNTTANVGSPVAFTVDAVGGTAPYTYSYYFGDGTFLNASSDSSVVHTYGVAGAFCASVVVADSADPADGGLGAGVGIGVGGAPAPACSSGYPALDASGNVSTASGVAPLTVEVSALATGGTGGPYAFGWSFGDGTVASGRTATHSYTAAGRYVIVLNVSDAAGDRSELEWNVTVRAHASGPSAPVWTLLVLAVALIAAVAIAAIHSASRRRGPPPGPTDAPTVPPAAPPPPRAGGPGA